MEILKTTIDKLKIYRNNYFESLPEFQELFLEIMIDNSDGYLLIINDKEIGYAIINREKVLIEFYVIDKYITDSNNLFRLLLKELPVTGIYCKSFDSLLLGNCMLCSLQYKVLGSMYRDFVGSLLNKDSQITFKKAGISSAGFLINQDNSIKELFETEQQLKGFIQNENVFLFYRNNEFIGCGMVIRTHKDCEYSDLGVWVEPSKRGNAYGSQIIFNLREFALENNMKPSCGCAIENKASQRTIEKAGFVSRHKMILFKSNLSEN